MNEKLRNFLVFEQAWKPAREFEQEFLVAQRIMTVVMMLWLPGFSFLIGLQWGLEDARVAEWNAAVIKYESEMAELYYEQSAILHEWHLQHQ